MVSVCSIHYDAVNHTYKPIYETDENDHIYPDNTAVGMTLVGRYTDQTERDGFGKVTTCNLKLVNKLKYSANRHFTRSAGLSFL